MTATIVEEETITGLEIIEGVDFDAALACEAWMHEKVPSHEPHYKVRFDCACGTEIELWCKDAWAGIDSVLWETACRNSSAGIFGPIYHSVQNGLVKARIISTL